jgi:hypothetical protein
MNELENEVVEVEIFWYFNNKNQKLYTPNFEFANAMARKYGTDNVYVEKY